MKILFYILLFLSFTMIFLGFLGKRDDKLMAFTACPIVMADGTVTGYLTETVCE